MVDVYEQGTGGGTSGSGDDSWGTGYQDKGCWGTITVTKGSEQTVYANFPVVNEDKVKCYKWSSKGSPAFSITSKNWNKCVVKGEFTGFTGSSSRLYCYMEYGTNSFQAYYDINVTAPTVTLVSNISLNKESVSLSTEETTQLTPTISPSNATYKTVTWASDNIDVATVSSNGLVKAVGEGSATITCRATDGSGVIATCKITVKKPVPPTGIIVSPSSMNINIGDTKTISYSLTPTDATTTVTWKSDNTSIATVSSSGLVKGIAEGKTTIRATTDNGKTASCEVTVKKVEATSISLPSTKTIYIGETVTLTYTMSPSNATNSVTWKSADTDIATVSSYGVVKGIAEGSTNITVTTDNGKSASCKVYVESKPIEPTKITLPTSCNVEVGYSTKISYTLEPENATTTITWKSSDTSIATVSSDGIVKGIKQGSTKITATTANGLSASVWVYVGGFTDGTYFYGTSSDDLDVTYRVTDINAKTCEVFSCNEDAKNIVIPSSVMGYKVTSIRDLAFNHCKVETVVLPNSIIDIGSQAFNRCNSLMSITIPNSVTDIGSRAFFYCENLESATLPNSITRIEECLFMGCKSLTNISGYNNVEYIGSNAFYDTPWLANLSDGANFIGRVLYMYKGKMPANTTFRVKDGCTQIERSAFSDQDGLVAITIPSSLVTLESNPFYSCDSLRSITVANDNPVFDSRNNCNAIIKTKENELVVGCAGTKIPNTVKSIGSYAFRYGNSALHEINIPDNVDSIANYAYIGAWNVKKITIGKGLRTMGNRSFDGCSRVNSITVSSANPYFDSRDNCNAIIETATNRLILGCNNTVIPNSIKTIGIYAFESNYNIASITIPNSVTAIEDRAFAYMDNLRSITIGKNVKIMGKNILLHHSDNKKLMSIRSLIDFPTDIDKDVFSKEYWLEDSIYNHVTLYIPKGSKANYQSAAGWKNFKHIVEIDDDEAFYGMFFTEKTVEGVELTYMVTDVTKKECELVASPVDVKGKVTIPSSANGFTVRSIGEKVFYSYKNDRALTEVVIPNTIKTFGPFAFYYCEDMIATIPSSVTSIGDYAFLNCKKITADDLSNVTAFGIFALVSCEKIENIKLGSSVKTIGAWAFEHTGITKITIPKSVENVGSAAFGLCEKLQSIKVEEGNPYYDSRYNCNGIFVKATNTLLAGCMNTVIPEETDTIGYGAFYYHSGLKEIKLPDNLKAIVDYAFYNTGISTITIPETVDSIGNGAFQHCTNLSSFKVLRKEPIRVKETVFFSETDTIYTFDQVTLYVPEGTKAKYQEADGWKRFKNIEEIVEQQEKKVTSITLSCAELSMAPGEKNQFTATILPEDATDKTVSWTTDNAAVATVSEDGLVTAVGQGIATITCWANDGSGVYATCEVTVKERSSWAGKYLVSGQHMEVSSVTKVYPDNFEMTIGEKNGGTYITSMFGNDLTTWNEGGFRLEMNDDGTASVNLTNDDVLDYVSDTGLLYAMYVWDDETGDWCDTWSLRLNEDGTISLGEFYVAAFTWDETDETWRGRTEALYYDLLAVKDDGSAVHEIAQDQPGIHVRNGVIELDEAADVTVYKENGMIVYQGKTDRVDGLAKGMYIVCVGEQRKKVMMK